MPDDSRLAIRLLTLGVALLAFGLREATSGLTEYIAQPDWRSALSSCADISSTNNSTTVRPNGDGREEDAMDEELRSPNRCPSGYDPHAHDNRGVNS